MLCFHFTDSFGDNSHAQQLDCLGVHNPEQTASVVFMLLQLVDHPSAKFDHQVTHLALLYVVLKQQAAER